MQYFCLPCGERQLQNARAHQSKNKSKASWHAALLSAQNSVCIPDVFSILIISTACSWRNQSHNKLWLCIHWVEATHTLCTVDMPLLTTSMQLRTCAFYSNISSSLAGSIMPVTWCLQVQIALQAMLRTHTIQHISMLRIKQQQQLPQKWTKIAQVQTANRLRVLDNFKKIFAKKYKWEGRWSELIQW